MRGKRPAIPPKASAAWPLLVLRSCAIGLVLGGYVARLLWIALRTRGRREAAWQYAGNATRWACEALGGVYAKLGQQLSTRNDLFPEAFLCNLRQLQQAQRTVPLQHLLRGLPGLEQHLARNFRDIDPRPIGSACMSQVYRALRKDDGRAVAVKIRRPGATREHRMDTRLIRSAAALLSVLPPLRSLPIRETVANLCQVLADQVDFELESRRHAIVHAALRGQGDMRIPALHSDLCTPDSIVTDYLPALLALNDSGIPAEIRSRAALAGLRTLYRMIFGIGLVHCDLHPGNLLCTAEGEAVMLDLGMATELGKQARTDFAEFFWAIACADASAATAVALRTALAVPDNLDVTAFEREIGDLLAETSGKRVEAFSIVGFVAALFAIQRRHGLYATPSFSLPITALLSFEGTLRALLPNTDFQREAVSYVMAALQEA